MLITIPPSTVEIWIGWLGQPQEIISTLVSVNTEAELIEACKKKFVNLRRRTVAGRAFTRLILASYLGAPPEAILFGYGVRGKPYLKDCPDLRFSTSASEDLFACAVATNIDVGLDIEKIRPFSIEEITHTFFTADEAKQIFALSGIKQLNAFFRCWTRKEAFLKATGEGLYRDLLSFDVGSLDADEASIYESNQFNSQSEWSLVSFQPAPEYVGAIASPSPPGHIEMKNVDTLIPAQYSGQWSARHARFAALLDIG